ncbi:hypothetical protein HBH70_177190 [Parastagonospora nodorum]|nr:hypothetical protein HBI10_077680 [Parastagonospora nodorum]KAH4026073.1 hypothetical protein HBI13_073490 [Parastagonospora nodorum]KAH4050087.1 hypothetical protein HBH49_128000 [Parastagonospora nodorum]KAH4062650.1 hypothetical protein HBH50_206010 [Parastagonospora nodorum]KAH4081204.1 hypothetical protein HBH48_201640 [Parastagonospora nodorum]
MYTAPKRKYCIAVPASLHIVLNLVSALLLRMRERVMDLTPARSTRIADSRMTRMNCRSRYDLALLDGMAGNGLQKTLHLPAHHRRHKDSQPWLPTPTRHFVLRVRPYLRSALLDRNHPSSGRPDLPEIVEVRRKATPPNLYLWYLRTRISSELFHPDGSSRIITCGKISN